MMNFLKSFLANEKTPEEKALLAAQKKRDVMMVGDQEPEEEQAQKQRRCGCSGCGCR